MSVRGLDISAAGTILMFLQAKHHVMNVECGHIGHYGQDCRGSKGETSAGGTPSSCFKCGEVAHFARECTTSVKAKKRTRDSSTPAGKKYPKDKKGNEGHKSAPQEFDKPRRKNLYLDDECPNWPSKPKRRGGWIPDDPDDQPFRNGWRSPATPNKNHRIFDLNAGRHGSSPQHFRNNRNFNSGSPNLRGCKPFLTTEIFPTTRRQQPNVHFRRILTRCEVNEQSSAARLKDEGASKLTIGSPIVITEAPKMIKTAASVPCLRVNSGLVNPGDVGRIVSRKPMNMWAVRLSIGTYLVDEKYFKPLQLEEE